MQVANNLLWFYHSLIEKRRSLMAKENKNQHGQYQEKMNKEQGHDYQKGYNKGQEHEKGNREEKYGQKHQGSYAEHGNYQKPRMEKIGKKEDGNDDSGCGKGCGCGKKQ